MKRFSLSKGQWVAMDRIPYDRSPVKILDIEPLKTGKGVLRVSFFHAWYPEGVQFKTFDLKIVSREERFIAGVDESGRLVVFHSLTPDWFRPMNVDKDSELVQSDDPVALLERHFFP